MNEFPATTIDQPTISEGFVGQPGLEDFRIVSVIGVPQFRYRPPHDICGFGASSMAASRICMSNGRRAQDFVVPTLVMIWSARRPCRRSGFARRQGFANCLLAFDSNLPVSPGFANKWLQFQK